MLHDKICVNVPGWSTNWHDWTAQYCILNVILLSCYIKAEACNYGTPSDIKWNCKDMNGLLTVVFTGSLVKNYYLKKKKNPLV